MIRSLGFLVLALLFPANSTPAPANPPLMSVCDLSKVAAAAKAIEDQAKSTGKRFELWVTVSGICAQKRAGRFGDHVT